ncbi:unnamed protein product [Psylliodes chrysocephalus]|uniref:Uncharacterized protein n=1 Tax=Psylliodes chrysocephalus TaxID=3402493 RepID=A0A9P0CGB3_9CUCU|nr:unnamed protein product [Psylliodes chrysocephala]
MPLNLKHRLFGENHEIISKTVILMLILKEQQSSHTAEPEADLPENDMPENDLTENGLHKILNKRDILVTPEKRTPSRWRISNPERHARNKRKIKRNFGHEYVGARISDNLTLRDLKPKYNGPVPLNPKKIANLSELLKYIPPIYHDYYREIGITEADGAVAEANVNITAVIGDETEHFDDFSDIDTD